MRTAEIFENIKESFCSLWSFKIRGKTLEIITPYSTTTQKFISIFITQQEDKFIVTDGGYLLSGDYETTPDYNDDIFMRIFNHYESFYEINNKEINNNIFYYKSTQNENLIPNLVYDLTNFLSNIISASQIQFTDQKEREEKETFRRAADNYLSAIISKDLVKFHRELGENYKSVRFNAIVKKGARINLIKYITGSTPSYFLSSLAKATVDFEIANHSPYNEYINNRIALVNDTAAGFVENKLFRYLQTLEEYTNIPSIKWSQKEELIEVI